MSNVTLLPNHEFLRIGTVTTPVVRLSEPSAKGSTSLVFDSDIEQEDDATAIAKGCILGFEVGGKSLAVYIAPSGFTSKTAATITTRPLKRGGLDITTAGDSDTYDFDLPAGTPVKFIVSEFTQEFNRATLQGEIATGANDLKIGDGTAADISLNNHTVKPKIYWDDSNNSQLKANRGDDEGAAGDFPVGTPRLTTAERDALTSPLDGQGVYNTTTGVMNWREGGTWVTNQSGSTVANGSTTVAGKFEEATTAEIDAATAAGGTGADLVVNPSQLSTSIYATRLPSADEKTYLTDLQSSGTTVTEIDQALDGISANVTAANLNTLTAGAASDADALHTHATLEMSANGGSFTKDTSDASGDLVIAHGLGKTPAEIDFTYFVASEANSYNGVWTSAPTHRCFGRIGNGGSYTTALSTDYAIKFSTSTTNGYGINGTITADATNFTIAWTKLGTPTGSFDCFWTAKA